MPKDEPVSDNDEGNDISITFETPDGRTQLNGEGLKAEDEPEPEMEENGVGTDDIVEDEPITVHVGSPPEEIGTISGMDLDTYIIDQEIAPLMEEGERYPGWRVGLSRKVGAYIELIRPWRPCSAAWAHLSLPLLL